MVSAAATAISVATPSSTTPVRSSASTSACDASHGPISAGAPVRMLTTPPGRSEVASTSARVIAGSGHSGDATTTQEFPLTMIGATTLTKPSNEGRCGAIAATTPVGSGTEKLK